jgi:hypothetical protein
LRQKTGNIQPVESQEAVNVEFANGNTNKVVCRTPFYYGNLFTQNQRFIWNILFCVPCINKKRSNEYCKKNCFYLFSIIHIMFRYA